MTGREDGTVDGATKVQPANVILELLIQMEPLIFSIRPTRLSPQSCAMPSCRLRPCPDDPTLSHPPLKLTISPRTLVSAPRSLAEDAHRCH